jgi:hypothetical protein
LSSADSQTEPKKKSRRLYLVLAATVLLIAVIIGVIIFEISDINQTNYGPGPVEIEVISDKPFYLQGEKVNFTIYVNNPHDWPVPYPNSVRYIIEKDDLYVASLGGGQIDYPAPFPMFPPNSKRLYQEFLMTWNQKTNLNGTLVQVQPGNYTLTVSFDGAVDYGDSSNCTFEIRETTHLDGSLFVFTFFHSKKRENGK